MSRSRRGARGGGVGGGDRSVDHARLPTRAASRGAPWWRRSGSCPSGRCWRRRRGRGYRGLCCSAPSPPAPRIASPGRSPAAQAAAPRTRMGSGPRPISPRFGSSWTREGDCTRSGERAASADRSWRDRRGASCPPRSGHAPSPRGQPSRRAIDCGTPELATAYLTNRASVRCPPTTRSVDSSQTNIRRRERLTPMSWNSSGAPRLPGSSHPYARGALARNDRDDEMTFA